MARVRKAVFPVAGLGTRFLPATKSMPKEMLTVVDKPVLQYAVEEARAAGIEHFIFVASRGKTPMEDHFDRSFELEDTLRKRGKDADLARVIESAIPSSELSIVRQQEPLGLGHAVWCARNIVGDEPFAVLLPDEVLMSDPPCLADLIDTHHRLGRSHVLSVLDVPREHTNRYGIMDPDAELDGGVIRAKGMVEKPDPNDAPSTAAAIGRYVLDPAVFAYLDKGVKGAGNEIQLTDAIAATMDVAPLHGCPFKGARYDCGDKLGFLKANIAFALQRPDLADGLRTFMAEIGKT